MACLMLFGSLMTAWAEDIEQLRQSIAQFKQQPVAVYAPMTLARAEAYLGAAMLAQSAHHADDEQLALARSRATLEEAKASSAHFQTSFQSVIAQRTRLHDLLAILPQETEEPKNAPFALMRAADDDFKQLIHASEKGLLNESQLQAQALQQKLQQVEKRALPYVLDYTQRTLSKAATFSAKRYAPQTYTQAKAGQQALRAYLNQNPEGAPKPNNILNIARQAKEALHIATLARQWRSDKGSYEQLFLQNQHTRQRLSQALGLPSGKDYSTDALLTALQQLQHRMQQQQEQAAQELSHAKLACAEEKQQALQTLKTTLVEGKNTQLAALKDAFRAKLERETFELKRQKRLRALFPEQSIKIISYLDGSLLIRLAPLKFAPGSAKLDAQYFDLLGRLKDALDIYGDRTFRIEGHTDSYGDVKENQHLSLRRAESVRDFLVAAGADASAIRALGYGEVRPIASNEFAKGREMNRRIDVVIEARGHGNE